MNRYDVIIIGAGPAGLSLAYELINEGKILIIEAKKEPHKEIACAEWVPKLKVFAPYKISQTDFMEILIGKEKIKKRFPGYVIDREKFQSSMLEAIKADIHTGERVLIVKKDIVMTTYSKYKAEWIVGAYGPYCPLSKHLSIHGFIPAINVRVALKKRLTHSIVYFDREILYGYAWCFPRGDMANCGIGAKSRILKVLLKKWLQFLSEHDYIDGLSYTNAHAGLIPTSILHKTNNPKHILIGDAGGFIDPLTGAGIASGIESAKIAASLIKGTIKINEYKEYLEKSYLAKYLKRRRKRRDIMERKWNNLKEAIEKSWISSYQG